MERISLRAQGLIVAIILSVLLPVTTFAAPPFKIGYFEFQKVLATSKAGQAAQKKLEAEAKKSQTGIDAKKAEYDKMQQAIEKQKASLTPKALTEKEEQLGNMEKELKRNFQDSREALRREQMRLVQEFGGKVRKVVEELGKEDGFTLILEKGAGVAYADAAIDVTDEVVKRFDAANK